MKTKKLLFIAVLIFLLFFVIVAANKYPRPYSNKRSAHQVKFFDEQTFNEVIDRAKHNKPFTFHTTGGIIPHHLFVGFIIADFFSRLTPQKPTTIILLGPNHYEKGNFKALTSLYDWNTPFGLVNPNDSLLNDLMTHNLVRVDEETLPNDHALSAIMPFIKYYLPRAKVVPILLSGGLTKDDSEILANKISSFITKDVIVIAPVDFSHYLTNSQAKEKDETTLQILKEFNYKKLYLLNNDYLDSPPSIGVLLMIMQKLKTTQMDLLYHSNSGEIQKDNFIQTTSYFEVAFY